jgi:hypothetical protein
VAGGWWSELEYESCRTAILGEVTDNCLGAFQVRWIVDTRHHDRPASERLALAEALVQELLSDGARLYTGFEVGRGPERTAIPEHNLDQVLRDLNTWIGIVGELVWLDRTRE